MKIRWPEAPAAERNAPCPCGSGIKYKKCHRPKDDIGEPCDNSFWETEKEGENTKNEDVSVQ